MSRGPGHWQREILAAIEQADSFYLVDLLPDDYTQSQYNAAHRAAKRLDDCGRISLLRFPCGTFRASIVKPGDDANRPPGSLWLHGSKRKRVKCWCGGNLGNHQHLTASYPHADTAAHRAFTSDQNGVAL